MTDDFCYLMRIRYAECDAQGVVFNAKYVEYIDVAMTEFYRLVGGDYSNISNNDTEIQVVNININWQAPARFDDIVAINMKTLRIGNTSFTLEAVFTNYETGQPLVSAEITYVMVSAPEYIKKTIPDEIRESLTQGAPGVVVDHAGALAETK